MPDPDDEGKDSVQSGGDNNPLEIVLSTGSVKDGHLFQELNASLQVQAKVDEDPLYAFSLVLLLLQHEHVVVEELLQFLVGKVDAQLLEAVELRAKKGETSQLGAAGGNVPCVSCGLIFKLRCPNLWTPKTI